MIACRCHHNAHEALLFAWIARGAFAGLVMMADGGKGKKNQKNHPQYRTKWCEFFVRSHGCRWGNECWHCHSAEDFVRPMRAHSEKDVVRPMRAHYTFPMDLRLKPADADVPGTTLQQYPQEADVPKTVPADPAPGSQTVPADPATLQGPQEGGCQRQRWAGSQYWRAWGVDDWHNWMHDWSGWGDWRSRTGWETESEPDAHTKAIDDFLAAQATADATAESAHTTGGADDEQESVAFQPMRPLADPRLAALIRACSRSCHDLPADTPLPPAVDHPRPSPADPPATRLLIATPLASPPPETPATCLQGAPPLPSPPPDPPTTRLEQAPPPSPSSRMPGIPCFPPPIQEPLPMIPGLDLTVLSPPLQDDPFDPDADGHEDDGLFGC